MKELSVEQKAKAYDEALKVLHKYDGANIMFSQSLKEEIFPELKESEDERIRKELISFFTERAKYTEDSTFNGLSSKEIIAWLEKHTDTDNKFIRMRETKPKDISEFLDRLTTVEQEFLWEHIAKIRELDKEEQKPADNIEPKFKVGQTIKKKGFNLGFTIVKIKDGFYYNNMGDCFPFTDQENWELVEQTSTWSEEDENRINRLIAYFEDKESFTAEDDVVYANWLKSLKDKYTWKPSEEQINLLEELVEDNNQRHFYNILRTLYEQLKKLRKE